MTETILPLFVCLRGNTTTLWFTAERILPLSVCLSVGFSRGVTATVCLSERGYCHSKTKKTLRRIFDPRPIAGTKFYIYSYIIFMGSTCTSIYMEIYVYCIHIYEYRYIHDIYNYIYLYCLAPISLKPQKTLHCPK